MAKLKTIYICSDCGYESSKWLGKCPECDSWGTLEEEVNSASSKSSVKKKVSNTKVVSFKDIEVEKNFRYTTKFNEFDRVLGGGLVKGAVVLLTGNPGIGKSTLLLQVVDQYSQYGEVLYISGEESPSQIKYRGDRLGLSGYNISIMSETEMESIYDYVIRKKPKVVVVDSIQTLYSSNFDSIPGTITQIRECTLKIVELAKTHDISFFLVGHITKDGKVAGPKLLEHMVDSVLQFEGQEGLFYRILRSLKNRFGSTNELGIFNMEEKGMVEVKNPSEFFLSERDEKNVGSIVVPVLEGTKIFLLEIQTLVNESPFGIPKRVVHGFDRNRIQILNAIMEKKIGLNLSSKDVFVNIPGGIKIYDGAADLGVVMAMISVTKGIEVSQKIAAIGELGLRGEIRKVSFVDKRLKELEKLGFSGVYLPHSNKKEIEQNSYNLKMIYLKNLTELAERMR
ncbi:DNA repair protein RadA [Psychrilyobacter sp.]|uniref:DNA repair protein RadA n=1 Tax=Psychrilyobacter sp. TaxID=2586924 RepID=UPI00301950F9